MSKTIKVEDEVYQDLDQFRGKGETFSDALRKVLKCAKAILGVTQILGPHHYLMGETPPSERRE